MIQAFIAKKLIDVAIKKVMQKKAVKNMRKYVEETNELDIKVRDLENENVILMKQIDIQNKKIDKYGKYIEELEKNVAILSKDSHSPVFTKKQHGNILKRLTKLEKKEN